MKKVTSLLMAFLALFAFSGGVVVAQEQSVTIALMEQNDSGQSGTATLTLSEDPHHHHGRDQPVERDR